jgi:hypothetical protein
MLLEKHPRLLTRKSSRSEYIATSGASRSQTDFMRVCTLVKSVADQDGARSIDEDVSGRTSFAFSQ